MMEYDPFNWHWIVGGDDSRFWSSKAGGYVAKLPKGAAATRILNEDELTDVLAVYGLPGPVERPAVPSEVETLRGDLERLQGVLIGKQLVSETELQPEKATQLAGISSGKL